jgi:formiminotetrahydrofolate cyclodeaminase
VTDAAYASSTLGAFVAAVGARSPAPASGSALAVAAALAAALAELTARLAEDDAAAAEATRLRQRLVALADEDAAAYAEYMERQTDEAKSRTIDVPLELAETAAAVRGLSAALDAEANRTISGDTNAAVELAGAVVRAAARLVEINVGEREDERLDRARALIRGLSAEGD